VSATELRVSVSPGERRVALLRDDRLHLAAVERPARPDGVGDLHRARITAISKPMSGAFLLLADGATAFLPESDAPDRRALHEGGILPVRLTRAAQGGKGPRATARLTPEELAVAAGDGVALLRRGPDAVLRLAAREVAAAPGRALALRAGPAVVAALEAMPEALAGYAAGAGRALRLLPDAALTPGREVLEEAR